MQAVLYVAHGTRLQAGIHEAIQFIKNQMHYVDIPIQTYSFIDLAKPTIEEGIQTCLNQGATKIAIVPVLLLAAGHVKEDIPHTITVAMKKYPNIKFTYGQPFGVNDQMIQTILERILEKGTIDEQTAILLVGRGSSDPSIRDDFAKITNKLAQQIKVKQIDVCYLAAQTPNLNEGIAMQVKNEATKIFVVPYLLFDGLLMRHLEDILYLIHLPHKQFHLCRPLGQSQHIVTLLTERIHEAVNMGVQNDDISSTIY